MLRLKTKRVRAEYPRHQCAASRCDATPVVDYHTDGGPWPRTRVPLCNRHWHAFAAAKEKEDG